MRAPTLGLLSCNRKEGYRAGPSITRASSLQAMLVVFLVRDAAAQPRESAPSSPVAQVGMYARAERPPTLRYEEGEPVPVGYSRQHRWRTGVIIAGAATFAVSYLFSLFLMQLDAFFDSVEIGCPEGSAESDSCDGDVEQRYWPLAVPLAGPFIALATNYPAGSAPYLMVDGLAQAGGVALFVLGVVSKRTVLVRTERAGLHVAPALVSGSHFGLAFSGSL